MNTISVTLLVPAVIGLLAGPAWCDIIAFDDFAVTRVGGAVGALGGETNGFAWHSNGYEEQGTGYLITNAPPLGYNTPTQILITNGSFASGGSAYTSSGRVLDTGVFWDPTTGAPSLTGLIKRISGSGSYIGADGANIWISFLVRNNAGSAYKVSLNSGEYGWWDKEGNAALPFAKVFISSGQWALEAKGTNAGSTLVSTAVSRTLGNAYLMVLNMTFADSNDVTKLYVNPSSIGGFAPVSADATIIITNDLYFRQMTWYPGDNVGNGDLDEFRMGDSYAAVTPIIPEPATLLALAFGALLLRRRRNRG